MYLLKREMIHVKNQLISKNRQSICYIRTMKTGECVNRFEFKHKTWEFAILCNCPIL